MAGVTSGVKIFVRHLGETLVLPTPADGSVTTAKMATNSVDGTKIAMGSDAQGDILYHGATDYARLAKGTASQTLKMNAGATAPEWVTVAAASLTWEYISTVTASSSATLAFTNMADGYDYLYVMQDIASANNGVNGHMQLGIAGPTYRTSGYKSVITEINNSGTSGSGEPTATINFAGDAVEQLGNLTDEAVKVAEIKVYNPAGTSNKTMVLGSNIIYGSSPQTINNHFGGFYQTAAEAHTSIKFYMSAGNIASGAILQYRRVRS
jgi:hypothetical protein